MIKEFSLRGWKVAGGSRNQNLLETLKAMNWLIMGSAWHEGRGGVYVVDHLGQRRKRAGARDR